MKFAVWLNTAPAAGAVTKYGIGGRPVQPMPPIAVLSHTLKFADVTKVFCGVSNAVTIKVRSTGPNAEAAQNEIIYYIKSSKQNIFEKNQPRLKFNTFTLSVNKHVDCRRGIIIAVIGRLSHASFVNINEDSDQS